MAIDHVQLAMPPGGEADARRFYVGVLKMREAQKPAVLAPRGGCWFEAGAGVEIHLGVDENFVSANKAHPALTVADIDYVYRITSAANASPEFGETIDGRRRLYFKDPFGNRIEAVELAPKK